MRVATICVALLLTSLTVGAGPMQQADTSGLNGYDTRLSKAEAQAKYNKEHGLEYNKKDYNKAMTKVRQVQKYRGERNKQKRKSENRSKGTNKSVEIQTPVSSYNLWHNYNPNMGITAGTAAATSLTLMAAALMLMVLAL